VEKDKNTYCDLTEEASRMDVADQYRSYEAFELKKLHKCQLFVDTELYEKLEARAEEKGQTVSELVSEIVLEKTKRN
jgi:hypothetical protein